MNKKHLYKATITWTGNKGSGTSGYLDYERSHTISSASKPDILASSDPSFRGNALLHNPEELFLSSLSSCHMLWFLHLCSDAGIVVTEYQDQAEGTMTENPDGSGQFTEVVLRPKVTITDGSKAEETQNLHHKANQMCFIARSCNFPVKHEAKVVAY